MIQGNIWLLYGTERYMEDDKWVLGEKLVAVFTSKKQLEEYVEASKAPTYRKTEWAGKFDQFLPESLLADCSGYRACPLDTPGLFVDPRIGG